MNNILPEQVQQQNILKIKAFKIQRIPKVSEYMLSVCAQYRGGSSFEWLSHRCACAEQATDLFARVVQLHIWSTPEDLQVLRSWRHLMGEWLEAPDAPLELEDPSIQPFLLDMIVMKPA